MTTTLTPARVTELNQSFAKLKMTAKSAQDICKWFKKHPQLIPGMPMEHVKRLKIDASSDEVTYDQKIKTAYDHQKFTFDIESVDVKPAKKLFADVTGFKLGQNLSEANILYFTAEYQLDLDAREWKFVALEALTGIEAEDINDPKFSPIYQNILAHHYPHYDWATFVALWQGDLLPNDPEDLDAVLKRPAVRDTSLVVPSDFGI